MFCTKCGSRNDDGAIYCSSCGEFIGQKTIQDNNNIDNNDVNEFNNINNFDNKNNYENADNNLNYSNNLKKSKSNYVLNVLIAIFSVIGCICVFFNSYVVEIIRSDEDEIEAYTAVGLNGFDAITGEYNEIIELMGSDFKEAEALQAIEIIYIILVLAFMVLEIVLVLKSKNNSGYVTNIITSSVNISIVFIIEIVTVIIIKEVENIKNYNMLLGTGMILLIFMQIIKIILSTMGIAVNGYKRKIDNI